MGGRGGEGGLAPTTALTESRMASIFVTPLPPFWSLVLRLVSIRTTTSFGPVAAAMYQGRMRGSYCLQPALSR